MYAGLFFNLIAGFPATLEFRKVLTPCFWIYFSLILFYFGGCGLLSAISQHLWVTQWFPTECSSWFCYLIWGRLQGIVTCSSHQCRDLNVPLIAFYLQVLWGIGAISRCKFLRLKVCSAFCTNWWIPPGLNKKIIFDDTFFLWRFSLLKTYFKIYLQFTARDKGKHCFGNKWFGAYTKIDAALGIISPL